MVSRMINVDTIDKVKALVGEATGVDFEVDIVTERFKVNAKSILGIFSLNRAIPVSLVIDADESDEDVKEFLTRISPYIVKD